MIYLRVNKGPCPSFSSYFLALLNMITDINGVPIQEALHTEGYVIIDNLIPDDLFKKLIEACDRVVEKARKGDWKYR
jgi:hypothetical protein